VSFTAVRTRLASSFHSFAAALALASLAAASYASLRLDSPAADLEKILYRV
jgi:hypothetical protein